MIYNYERVLRQVTYSNKKPAYYLNRQFRITCSELNGRFVSNEYIQTVSRSKSQKVWDFDENRLHWASIVRDQEDWRD